MRVSTNRPPAQLELLPEHGYESRPLTVAATRSFVGDFVEEMTVAAFGGTRLKTDSRADICPDIKLGDNLYLECKSIGRTKDIIVYLSRLEKDLEFVRRGNRIFYVLWNHDYKMVDGLTLGGLRDGVAQSFKSVSIIDLATLAPLLKATPVKTLNASLDKRSGYGSYGYTDGYRLRLDQAKAQLTNGIELSSLEVYGRRTSTISVYRENQVTLPVAY
jgi:hypothetical protein